MNIPYASLIRRAVVNGENETTHLNQLKAVLQSAEWEVSDTTSTAQGRGTLGTSSTNLNNSTVTIGSIIYRFVITVSQAYHIKIESTTLATYQNLVAAINGTGTPGVNYGIGTAAHPDVSVTATSSDVDYFYFTLTHKVSGPLTVTLQSDGYVVWPVTQTSRTSGGGFVALTKSDHPAKYRLRFYASVTSTLNQYGYQVSSQDASRNYFLNWTVGSGIIYVVRATPYDFHIYRNGTITGNFYCGALWNPAEWAASPITAITPGATTTITQTAHGMTTGQTVTLSGITGSDNWIAQTGRAYSITRINADSYTIPLNSTTFGTPVSLGVAGSPNQITMALVAGQGLRNNNRLEFNTSWSHINGTISTSPVDTMTFGSSTGIGTPPYRIGFSDFRLYHPVILVQGTSLFGACWNAVLYQASGTVTTDLDQIPLDNRKWFNLKIGSGFAIFLEVPAEV